MKTNMRTILAGINVSDRAHRHEVMRWTSMTEKALFTRLKKITKVEKLAAFYMAARMYGKEELRKAAGRKLRAVV